MLHLYAILLAVVLLVGALAAIIVCVCVDIVPIIKSRGSTLLSRDSVTQEQARALRKSLQRTKLTSSASADFIDSAKGRKARGQALRHQRPRYGSTPLTFLSREEEKSEELSFKTTTVIMEALPKKPKSDIAHEDEKISESKEHVTRRSSSNISEQRSNSTDRLDAESSQAIHFNSRNPGMPNFVPRSQDAYTDFGRQRSRDDDDTMRPVYAKVQSKARDSLHNEKNTNSHKSAAQTCRWCDHERQTSQPSHRRQVAYSKDQCCRADDFDSERNANGFPYDKNKFCRHPHQGYSPCPDCFHTNVSQHYVTDYYGDAQSQNEYLNQGNQLKNHALGVSAQILSTSSSSSSSGSSSRFRHIRQPLEDIQEDASDCYALRDGGRASSIDSRDLESGPDDGTIPKSSDHSATSASPIIASESQTPVFTSAANT